jgi:hypothetical protein
MAMLRDLKPPKNMIFHVLICTLVVLAAINIPATLRYFELRQQVDRRYQAAFWAKQEVVKRAVSGDLSGLNRVSAQNVSFSPTSGVITVSFPDLPVGPEKTLKLLPVVIDSGVHYPLEVFMNSRRRLESDMIYWLCTSSRLRARESYIRANLGTLDIELAPAECRHVDWVGFADEISGRT